MMRCSNFRALNHVDTPILLFMCIFQEFRLKIYHHLPIYKITILSTQNQSAIVYHDQKQKEVAERSKEELEKEGVYRDAFVTEITPLNFYVEEIITRITIKSNYQDDPRIHKLLQQYENDLKQEELD